MSTLIGTARCGTLEELKQFYQPGMSRAEIMPGRSLLSMALTDNDAVNRSAKAMFLLDEGSDPKWYDTRSGMNLLHILVGQVRGNVTVPDSDLVLLRRLLAGGASVNGLHRKYGTPVQLMRERSGTYSEGSIGPVYDVLFSQPDLDVFLVGSFRHSIYQQALKDKDMLPVLWSHVERYVRDHGLLVPVDQQGVVAGGVSARRR